MIKESCHDIYDEIKQLLEQHHDEIIGFGRELFDCPELGFKEVKTNEILTSFFERNGISCKNDIAITGVRADIGSGDGYHIALAADMDAIYAKDGERMVPIHSCGHSIQTSVLAWVMKILNDSGLMEMLGGRVSFIAAPAEEFIDFDYRERLRNEGKIQYFSGKQNMIEQGIFDDIDCVISMHINGDSDTMFDINSTLAGFMVKKVVFKGTASHSGAAPHLGRNALHGVNLCMSALSCMKDQFPKETGLQLHPVITSCSGSVNIIPEEAVMESYIRANTLNELMLAGEKFDRCAIHSAKALGLECEIQNETGYMPLLQSKEINSVIYKHMLAICEDNKIVQNVISGASGDVGDLGYLIPTVQFGFFGAKGRIHSCDFDIVDEENAYINTAEIVLKTICDILANPELQVKNPDFAERKNFYMENWLRKKL